MSYISENLSGTQKLIDMTLLEIFSAPIASGAQLFLLIVCVLIGLGAGLSAVDLRNTTPPKESKDNK